MSEENLDKKKSEAALREERILEFWKENKTFEKSLEQSKGKKDFIFYDGPVTANSKPVLHTMVPFSFKDVIPRYKTMRGYHVRRKGGWDTHGLPVELQIEKKLGFNSKADIENYGIAAFNKLCKDSVWEYVGAWKSFTERMGYWADQENAYVTYHNEYIESLWNVVKKINDQKLLYKDYKVVPWCPRCGTALSSHELAQGYEDVKDLSVYVKFPVKDGSASGGKVSNTYILAWTTTPWTLPGNVALAVGENIDYVKIKVTNGGKEEFYILAKTKLSMITEPYEIAEEIKGAGLVGLEYEPLFPFLKNTISEREKLKLDKAYRVHLANFVTTADGTGVVHTAVMYGQDDFELGTKVGLPKHHLVGLDGKFLPGTGFLEGRFVKDEQVAVDIIKDLAHRGLLYKKEKYEHSYPHCWRCKTPLIYYARDSWYIKMSDPRIKEKLIAENKNINWEPAHIRDGRFGEWLREIKDWAISRERYWGTPLPVWQCASCKKTEVIGSIDELKKRSGGQLPKNEKDELDLHRPYIDEVELVCSHATAGQAYGGKLIRTKEVMDVWFDSGAMPFAQDHYPFQNKEWVEGKGYPADYISEAIDQTRGWFYTLHAVGILMGRGTAFKNVICLGHLMDANGKKMSKSLGNIVDPWQMIEKYGVDTLRLWMYSVNQPGESKNFDEKTVALLHNQVFGLLYNVLAFYELYRDKNLEKIHLTPWPLSLIRRGVGEKSNILDQWILARLDELTDLSIKNLDNYKLLEPVRGIRDFIGDLSTWYLRRSRDRIKAGDNEAKATLYFVLKTLAKLMAPFAPFAAEDIWLKLKNEDDKESVHLESWPHLTPWPLSIYYKWRGVGERSLVIKNMESVRKIVTLGLEARQKTGIKVRQPLASLKVKSEKEKLTQEYLDLIKEELNVKEVVFDNSIEGEVWLDIRIDEELKAEGDYRELVRALQDMRKKNGLTPSDVISLTIETNKAGKELVQKFEADMKKTVLVSSIEFAENAGEKIKIDNLHFRIKIDK
ncbi:isoleucine--tRNA ligase [Candidatus Nomurabacteria bacterium]|nr:isoleucine--tRNA ligase [Candidatus Nomurabacteria bacterium]